MSSLRVLAITNLFPHEAKPWFAPFNKRQFGALGKLCELEVLGAIPYFPAATRFAPGSEAAQSKNAPSVEVIAGLKVRHPRWLHVPKITQYTAGALFTASLLPHVMQYRGKIDAILGGWAYPDGVAAILLAKMLGVPVVVKTFGSDINGLDGSMGARKQLEFFLPRAERVVAVSRQLKDKIINLGVLEERIDVVHDGVDAKVFYPRDRAAARRELQLTEDAPTVVYVGNVLQTKGLFDLIDSFQSVLHEIPDAQLVIVGSGAEMGACQERAASLGSSVIFAGRQPPDSIPQWMAAADIVTLPSWAEGTPNVVREASACGRRVVASNVGGIPDILDQQLLGELIPPREPKALAKALIRGISDDYDADAVAKIGASHSWDDSATDLLASLESAVAMRVKLDKRI
jgi:teichuronic acid biosynthesis glycosyltransferase TuaC